MVLDENGEKWACEPCIRGHRVSSCTHTDRELRHIAKKGRPVSQCPHCRQLRKERSSHVKCDCGEKTHGAKEKCCHLSREKSCQLKKGTQKNQNATDALADSNPDTQHLDLENCQCHETGKCVCALKTEAQEIPPANTTHRTRPRLYQTQSSEPQMLHVINGHHKPAHKNNHAAHEYGVPYRIPSFHPPQTPKTGANGSTESLPTMDTFGRVPDTPISYFDGISGQRRMSKSEQASPSLLPFVATPTSDGRATTSQPSSASLEFPYLSGLKNDDISSYWNINTNLSSQDSDVGLLSATSLGPGMWTFGGNELPLNNRNRSESEPLTWANGDTSALAQPALTHSSSSRPQSELEDPFGFDDPQLLASAESRHSALNVDLESWTSRNLTDNLRQEPINNRWSMPSFPGEDSSSFDISTFQFPGQHKDNLVGQTRGSAMENIRPASVVQHSSVSYDNITSQPRSASTLDLSSTTKPQLPSGNGNDETLDWLNTLSWDYDIPAAEAFDNRTMDGLPLFPDDNGSNIALSNNVTGEELLGDMLVPSSGTPNKAVYDNPTGNVSYIGATPRTNPNPSDWLH